ncbi:hypothetical protein [Streptomyces sp. NPDC005435]|uniref:hypothetical protein n=1 Tax=Streptomyces sp. NPDC005435 TaxID=3154464 RepID=UPI003454CA88
MHRDLTRSLQDGDLQPLRNWLVRQGVDAEELRGLPRWNATAPLPQVPSARRPMDRGERVTAAVGGALPRVTGRPGGAALLLLYVLHEVENAWEISYHLGPLWDTLRGAGAAVTACLDSGTADGNAAAARAVLAAVACVDSQICGENHLTTGQLRPLAEAMERAVEQAREVAYWAAECSSDFPDLGSYLLDFARERELYCRAMGTAVSAVVDFFERGASLEDATRVLREAEDAEALARSPYRSELRAHRFSLESLHATRHESWLHVDHGRLVYVYPFAVRGCDAEEFVEVVRSRAADWVLGGTPVTPAAVHASLDLDDSWDGSDSLNRRYEGAFIELPDVILNSLEGPADGELGRVRAQIVFSDLGNHYVRFEAELSDTSPDELYWLMARAAPEYGVGRVRFEDAPAGATGGTAPAWSRLSDLAVQLAEDVGSALRGEPGYRETREVTRPGQFQVLVAVNSASAGRGPGGEVSRTEIRRPGQLMGTVGFQVLGHEIEGSVGALAEWVRFCAGSTAEPPAGRTDGEALLRTPNTVVLVALGRADWVLGTWITLAEFTMSLDALFAGWSDELGRHYARVKDLQTRASRFIREEQRAFDGRLDAFSVELDAEKIALDNFAVEARSMIALIKSPTLLSSPSVAESLRELLRRSEFQLRADELNVKLDEVSRDQLTVVIEKLATHRTDSQRAKLEVFLAVIAAAGVSGLVQVLQAGLGASSGWAVVSVVGIVVGAILLGIWVGRFWQRNP